MEINEILTVIFLNLEKVGFGVALFLCAYLSNIGLGAWRNVKIEGYDFDWKLILQSIVKFGVMGISLALLSMVVSTLPTYATYIGIEISAEVMQTIDSLAIVGAFLTATIRYAVDAINKLKVILGIGE